MLAKSSYRVDDNFVVRFILVSPSSCRSTSATVAKKSSSTFLMIEFVLLALPMTNVLDVVLHCGGIGYVSDADVFRALIVSHRMWASSGQKIVSERTASNEPKQPLSVALEPALETIE